MSATVPVIGEDGALFIAGKDTGFGVVQWGTVTVVYNRTTYAEVPMPHMHYSLTCKKPPNGNPGRDMFNADFVRFYADVLAKEKEKKQ